MLPVGGGAGDYHYGDSAYDYEINADLFAKVECMVYLAQFHSVSDALNLTQGGQQGRPGEARGPCRHDG